MSIARKGDLRDLDFGFILNNIGAMQLNAFEKCHTKEGSVTVDVE